MSNIPSSTLTGNSIHERRSNFQAIYESLNGKEELYEYFFTIGKGKSTFPPEINKDDYLIAGCQYKIWIYVRKVGAEIAIFTDSDSRFLRGVLRIYRELLTDLPAQEILKADLNFMDEMVLDLLFIPGRTRGIKNAQGEIKRQVQRLMN